MDSHFVQFLHRDHNTVADAMATSEVESFGCTHVGKGFAQHKMRTEGGEWKYVRIWFDGGFHSNKMGAGVVVEVASDFDHVEMLPTFRLLFKFGTRLRSRVTGNSKVAESCAVGLALLSLFELLHIRSTQQPLTWTPYCRPQPRTEYGRICWRAIEDLLDSL